MTSAVSAPARARAPTTVKPHQAPLSRDLPARLATEFRVDLLEVLWLG